jgi:hypothetical protein
MGLGPESNYSAFADNLMPNQRTSNFVLQLHQLERVYSNPTRTASSISPYAAFTASSFPV